jgi:hypothetical protein
MGFPAGETIDARAIGAARPIVKAIPLMIRFRNPGRINLVANAHEAGILEKY